MSLHSLRRLERFLPQLAVAVLWLSAVGYFAWTAANWLWRLKQPEAPAVLAFAITDPARAASDITSKHLLGEAPSTQTASIAPPAYTLLGVASHSGRSPGFAVLKEQNGAARGYVLGENIRPDMRLVELHPDSVELEQEGARFVVKLVESVNTITPVPTAPAAAVPSASPQDSSPNAQTPPMLPPPHGFDRTQSQ